MQVSFDTISTIHPTPIAPTPQPRAPQVDGPQPRERKGQRRDTGAGSRQPETNFRTVLDATESSATAGQGRAAPHRTSAEATAEAIRPTRLPDRQPPQVEEGEGAEIFRHSHAAQPEPSPPSEPRTAFIKAASSYSDRFFSIASTYARPGERLEIRA